MREPVTMMTSSADAIGTTGASDGVVSCAAAGDARAAARANADNTDPPRKAARHTLSDLVLPVTFPCTRVARSRPLAHSRPAGLAAERSPTAGVPGPRAYDGSESWRERVCQSGLDSVVPV